MGDKELLIDPVVKSLGFVYNYKNPQNNWFILCVYIKRQLGFTGFISVSSPPY